MLWITVIDILLANEFNALRYKWKDTHRVILRWETGVKKSTQSRIKKRAFERGFLPEQDPRILGYYVEDGARSGRQKETSLTNEQALLESVRADRSDREKSGEVLNLAYEQGISSASALRILHK
jgi:hypothetical protein